jgi:ATP-dependent DNA helicase RecG
MNENQDIDKKSLKLIAGPASDWREIAKDCVCFANARGGTLLIGIEKTSELPPKNQRVDPDLLDKLYKTIPQMTHNVGLAYPEVKTSPNGGEYIELRVLPSVQTVASTTDARYYMRVADTCQPVPPDQLSRLFGEKNAFVWELQTTRRLPKTQVDDGKVQDFLRAIRSSDRVSDFVRLKGDDELLEYYSFVRDGRLTNLGILWIGTRIDRASLFYPPSIQFIRYSEREEKTKKEVFDDHTRNPIELIEAVLTIADWDEATEIPAGIFRHNLPVYDKEVVRELVANALVHRPYTTAGDIYINMFVDRIEVHNPGLLPLGVTPANILHQAVHRNQHLAKIFYDLKIMECEGSGYDRIYQILVSGGKRLPVVKERDDRVIVTVYGRVINPEIVRLMDKVSQDYQLKQKELITLGLIAQTGGVSAIELKRMLALRDLSELDAWIGNLLDQKLIRTKGRTKGMQYLVNPDLLRQVGYKGKTSLKQIEDHRLKELIAEDVGKFPGSQSPEIQERIGREIPLRRIRQQLYKLIDDHRVRKEGVRRHTRYFPRNWV